MTIPLPLAFNMKRTLLSLLLVGALGSSAAAQSGWGSSDGWDTPKKAAAKKAASAKARPTPAATPAPATGAAAAPLSDGGVETSAAAAAATQSGGNAGNAATPAGAFGSGGTSRNDGPNLNVAPGMPVMLQSGRSVLANDAAAARERRLRRMAKPQPAASAPATGAALGAEGTLLNTGQAASAGAGMSAAGAVPSAPAGTAASAVAAPKVIAPSKAAPARQNPKKAAAAPSGW